jgi:hypothetical protein
VRFMQAHRKLTIFGELFMKFERSCRFCFNKASKPTLSKLRHLLACWRCRAWRQVRRYLKAVSALCAMIGVKSP